MVSKIGAACSFSFYSEKFHTFLAHTIYKECEINDVFFIVSV